MDVDVRETVNASPPFTVMWPTTAEVSVSLGDLPPAKSRLNHPIRQRHPLAGHFGYRNSDLLKDRDIFVAWDRRGQANCERARNMENPIRLVLRLCSRTG